MSLSNFTTITGDDVLAARDYCVELGHMLSLDRKTSPEYKVIRIYDTDTIKTLMEGLFDNSGNDSLHCSKILTNGGQEWYVTLQIRDMDIKTLAFTADNAFLKKLEADKAKALEDKLQESMKIIVGYM